MSIIQNVSVEHIVFFCSGVMVVYKGSELLFHASAEKEASCDNTAKSKVNKALKISSLILQVADLYLKFKELPQGKTSNKTQLDEKLNHTNNAIVQAGINAAQLCNTYSIQKLNQEEPLQEIGTWQSISGICFGLIKYVRPGAMESVALLEKCTQLAFTVLRKERTKEFVYNTYYHLYDSYLSSCFSFEHDLADYSAHLEENHLENIIYDTNYSLIPKKHRYNSLFRKFKCGDTQYPIRYPVVIVSKEDPILPIRIPIQFFERKLILQRLTKNSFYPKTNIPFTVRQVKEHKIIRGLIEREIQRLNINLR